MGRHLLKLLFLIVYVAFTNGSVEIYITPSEESPCPQDPRLTLSQFTAHPSKYTGNEMNIGLAFLPGNHALEGELALYGANNFSMESQDNETVVIECASPSARFAINKTSFVSIKGLQFIGCRSNIVTAVEEFIVENTIFQGMKGEGKGTALVLDKVTLATIIKCQFISITLGINSQQHRVEKLLRAQRFLWNYLGLYSDDLVLVGGVLLTTYSNVSIVNTKFVFNTAVLGGVLLAYQSNVAITQCTYSYNRAYTGGVMFTIESSVTIHSSTFSDNAAEGDVSGVDNNIVLYYSGGVVYMSGGSLTVINSIITSNTAPFGGVMDTLNGSVKNYGKHLY